MGRPRTIPSDGPLPDVAMRRRRPADWPGRRRLHRTGRGALARATPGRFMAPVAIQEADAHGEVVTWLEHVSDDEYAADGSR